MPSDLDPLALHRHLRVAKRSAVSDRSRHGSHPFTRWEGARIAGHEIM